MGDYWSVDEARWVHHQPEHTLEHARDLAPVVPEPREADEAAEPQVRQAT